MSIKAIETIYKGFRFRSRLEARWAVFFDKVGIEWQYEAQGFNLPDGTTYLPDFFLPQIRNGLWVEIKGQRPTESDGAKMRHLVNGTNHWGTIRVGEPMNNLLLSDSYFNNQKYGYLGEIDDSDHEWAGIYVLQKHYVPTFFSPYPDDHPYLFCVCPVCHKIGFEFLGRGERVCDDTGSGDRGKFYSGDHPKIYLAALAARKARFEHHRSDRYALS